MHIAGEAALSSSRQPSVPKLQHYYLVAASQALQAALKARLDQFWKEWHPNQWSLDVSQQVGPCYNVKIQDHTRRSYAHDDSGGSDLLVEVVSSG